MIVASPSPGPGPRVIYPTSGNSSGAVAGAEAGAGLSAREVLAAGAWEEGRPLGVATSSGGNTLSGNGRPKARQLVVQN